MVQRQATISKKSAARQRCRHYWVIESPRGRTSRGICTFCGAQREFKNYLRDCLGASEEEYQGWRRRLGYDQKERNPEEEVLSKFRGDKDAVEARS